MARTYLHWPEKRKPRQKERFHPALFGEGVPDVTILNADPASYSVTGVAAQTARHLLLSGGAAPATYSVTAVAADTVVNPAPSVPAGELVVPRRWV